MKKGLQQYSPMIRTKMEVLKDIQSRRRLSDAFYSWEDPRAAQRLLFR